MTDLTKPFLKCISKHLSGRDECKHTEYRVLINEQSDGDYIISIQPLISVYRSTYDRKIKYSILEHLLLEHFREEFMSTEGHNPIHSNGYTLSKGEYRYKKSCRTGRRKWIQINRYM